MANREIRDSEFTCPNCGDVLTVQWAYEPDGGITGGKEWQAQGRATCPQGHKIEWTAAGTPA